MSTRHLECLFRPRAILVLGAAAPGRGESGTAALLLRHLQAGGFGGAVMQFDPAPAPPVPGPHQDRFFDAALAALPALPDLALLDACTDHLPRLIAALGRRGTRAAILFAAGVADGAHAAGAADAVQAGRHGVLTDGRTGAAPPDMPAILAAARLHRLRILGPQSVGLIVPALRLHASLIAVPEATSTSEAVSTSGSMVATTPQPPPVIPLAGTLAFVSQSGALASAALDWACARGIGFSKFVSVGRGDDVDLADLLDFLARDPQTHAILLYVEQIDRARKFLSAARAAARGKPVVILKAGRAPAGAHAADHSGAHAQIQAATSHAGMLTGMDAVADAAIRRAGMLRVNTIQDLFGAARILGQARRIGGEGLWIVANGAGPGLLAADALLAGGGHGAGVAPGRDAPPAAVHSVNLGFGATPDDYVAAVQRLLSGVAIGERGESAAISGSGAGGETDETGGTGEGNDAGGTGGTGGAIAAHQAVKADPGDAILVIHAPGAGAPADVVARRIAPLLAASGRTVLSCWLGGRAAVAARHIATMAGIAAYATPEDAVTAFLQMVEHRRNQALLMQVPPSVRCDGTPRHEQARRLIDAALAAGRSQLSEPEAKSLLAAYGIPVVQTRFAADVDAAVAAAAAIGFPVALKIVARGVLHKSDVGGVVLDLDDGAAVAAACRAMQLRLAQRLPNATVDGFSVQAMARRGAGHELIIGAATDPVFGTVILFGQGGVAVEVMDDKAIGLPPLNMVLARDMVSRTRVARLLAGYRNLPAADIDAICHTLVQVAYLVAETAEIVELDINPLLADADGVIVLDAHVRLARPAAAAQERLAIRPYPQELEEWIDWQGSPVLLRPIRPEDGEAHLRFVQALQPEDVRYRMFVAMRQLPAAQLARFTQIDYDREMAFIATRPADQAAGAQAGGADPRWETLGVARVVIDAATNEAEFAIIVRSDLKGHGLGTRLMDKLIAYCRSRGIGVIVGEALADNAGLRRLVRRLGFSIDPFGEQGVRGLHLALQDDGPARPPAGAAIHTRQERTT